MLETMRASCFGSANLVVHQSVADIFQQTVEPLCILGVVEEFRETGSDRH